MSELGTLAQAVGNLREVTAQLLDRVNHLEDGLAQFAGAAVGEADQARHQEAIRTLEAVRDELGDVARSDAEAQRMRGSAAEDLNASRDGGGNLTVRPSTDLVARVNQALERLGASGGYVDHLRRLESKMDKQVEDMHTFESIVTELATAVSRTLKQQSEAATKRDLLDTRGMLMVALDNLKQSLAFRSDSEDATESGTPPYLRWIVAALGLTSLTLALIYLLASRG